MTPEQLEAEFVRLAEVGELDRIQRILRTRRDQVPREVVREIVQEACLEVVKRQQAGGKITNVAGLVMTIGGRLLEKAWQELVQGRQIDAEFARREREAGAWQHDEAWQARLDRAVEYVFKAVADWPVDNLRRTLLLIIDAAVDGVQLESRDLDAALDCAHGTGRVWRDRAYDRLRAQFERDGLTWDDISTLLPEGSSYDDPDEDVPDPDEDTDEDEED